MNQKIVETEDGTFYNMDCREGAGKYVKSNSVDLIITDPPYGIDGGSLHKHYNRDEKFVFEGYVEIPAEEYGDFSIEWIKEAERILKPGGTIYIVSGYTNLYHILHALRQTSLKEINHIIWKYNFGVFTKTKYISSHYHILYYEKPKSRRTFNTECRYSLVEKGDKNKSLNYEDREDVWVINREYKPGTMKNKNELPTELLKKMILYSSQENDLVCDMFLGGFSTASVAIGLNRKALGFEIAEDSFKNKIPEMQKLKKGMLLSEIRKPKIKKIENQGKAWTKEEKDEITACFQKLTAEGHKKKEAVEILQQKYQRGYWSIEKILKAEKEIIG